MKNLLRLLSFTGLGLMFAAAILVFNGMLPLANYHVLALGGTGLWFATVPFWMKRRLHQSE